MSFKKTACLFSKVREKEGIGLDMKTGGKDHGKDGGEEIMIRICCVKIIFDLCRGQRRDGGHRGGRRICARR